MAEQRLIDANAFKECWKPGVIGDTLRRVIDGQPTIDPETLPVVQQLRAKLERVTAERDALLKEFAGECGMCDHYEDCIKNHHLCCDGAEWEWRGLQEANNNE